MPLALTALGFGFALEMGPAGQALGQAVALAVAAAAHPILNLAGLELLRDGVELRATNADWAVRVSEVCDGMGLVVALAALVLALAPGGGGGRFWIARLALGLAAIQLFNLVRVVVLAWALDRWPAGFPLLHDQVFPLATLAVLGAAVLAPVRLGALALLTAGLGLLWTPLAPAAAAGLAAVANTLLAALAPAEVGTIAERGGVWTVGSLLLAGTEPLRLHLAPLNPAHFALALPAVAAAALLARRLWPLVLALPLMALALTIAAPVAVWALALAEAPATLLREVRPGAYAPEPFAVPETLRGALRVVQNALVHFNLLVLPILALALPHPRPGHD